MANNPLLVSWSVVLTATNTLDEKNILGKGAFATVYYADLTDVKRQVVDKANWVEIQRFVGMVSGVVGE